MILDIMLKEIRRKKLRTALTILGISIGILLVVSINSFAQGISIMVNSELNYISGLVIVIDDRVGLQNIMSSEIDESLADEISQISGVDEVAPIVYTNVHGFGNIIGVDPEHFEMFSSAHVGLDEGREVEKDAYELDLGYKIAEDLGLVVGDKIMIKGKEYEIVGIFKESGKEDDNTAITSLSIAQEIAKKEDKVTMIMVKPTNINDVDEIANEIQRNYDGITALSDKEAKKRAEEIVNQINIVTFTIGGIAGLVAGIVIMNVMIMSVRERRREIGIMKAIGATNTQILFEIILESISMSIIGACIGLFFSTFSVAALNSLMKTNMAVITPNLIFSAFLFALVLGVLGGILPARQAEKLTPVEALRYE
jgi:putative ABC transport system permease protein